MPAWAFDSAANPTWTAILGGSGGVLLGFGLGAIVNERLNPTYAAVKEAINFHADPTVPGNLRSAVRDEVAAALAEVASSSVDFGPRARLFDRLQFHETRSEVIIQAISLSSKWQITQRLEDLLKSEPSVSTRILLMHPYADQAAMRERDLGFAAGTIRQLVAETLIPLSSLSSKMNLEERLQVRGYFAIPYYGITCTDRRRLVLSLSREGRGGDQNLGAFVEATSQGATEFVQDLLDGFDDRWNQATNLLGEVTVVFVPGSERIESNRIAFDIEASAEIDLAAIVCESPTSDDLKIVPASAKHHYTISGRPISSSRPQRFSIVKAIAQSEAGWLRDPLEIPLPSFDALTTTPSGSQGTVD